MVFLSLSLSLYLSLSLSGQIIFEHNVECRVGTTAAFFLIVVAGCVPLGAHARMDLEGYGVLFIMYRNESESNVLSPNVF